MKKYLIGLLLMATFTSCDLTGGYAPETRDINDLVNSPKSSQRLDTISGVEVYQVYGPEDIILVREISPTGVRYKEAYTITDSNLVSVPWILILGVFVFGFVIGKLVD